MDPHSLRSSQYSNQDTRYMSSAPPSIEPVPPSKVLMEGYKGVLDPIQDEHPRYNPLNPSHPRSSVLLHADDPVVMHLLAETALSDSTQFEVLSFEEVEGLKKELSFLTSRIDATRRKLALETKLQEAAISLSRLYDKRSSKGSEDGSSGSGGSPRSHRRRPSFFGHGSDAHNRSDSEVAISTRKCEELAQDLWKLERRAGDLRRRLLEHTAGVLQMTHRGLKKKGSKQPEELNGEPKSPDVDYFDDRSLYKTADYLDEFPSPGGGKIVTSHSAGKPSLDMSTIQMTTARLEELNHKLRVMILEARPTEGYDPIPRNIVNGTELSSTETVQAHLDYLERGLESMASHPQNHFQETNDPDYETEDRLEDLNQQLEDILVEAGARQKYSPHASTVRKAVPEQLIALGTAISDVKKRLDGLTEQKTILTIQIQQQRELNSKSDAERDAHIADLTEQIMHLRKDVETAQHEANDSKEELATAMAQLDATRQQLMLHEQDRTADEATKVSREELQAKEAEVSHLEATIRELRAENDQHGRKALESKDKEIERLEATVQQLRSEGDERTRNTIELKDEEIAYLESAVAQLNSEKDQRVKEAVAEKESEIARLEESVSAKEKEIVQLEESVSDKVNEIARLDETISEKEGQISRLEEALSQLRAETEEKSRRGDAEKAEEVTRLELLVSQLRSGEDRNAQELAEKDEALARAEQTISEMQSEQNRRTQELAEKDEELARAENTISEMHSEQNRKTQELAEKDEALARAEHAISEVRSEQDRKLQEVLESKEAADNEAMRLQSEYSELESEMIRLQTELTMVKAELDGAYGSRAQRAAEAAVNPALQKEMEDLSERNLALTEELAALKAEQGNKSNSEQHQRIQMLEAELRGTIDDYEALTKSSIEFEKERDKLESMIDEYRDRCEELESQLYDERIQGLGNNMPSGLPVETTSTMVLKTEFKRMMREARAEGLKAFRAEQEERRRLEGLLRSMKKEQYLSKPNLSQSTIASSSR